MGHAWGKIVAILVAAAMFCVIPLLINLQRQENMIQLSVMDATVEFVDTARNLGMISCDEYNKYQKKISKFKEGLEIALVYTTKSMVWENGGIRVVENCYTEQEIKKRLNEERVCYLKKGDYLRAEVRITQKSLLDRIYGHLGIVMGNTTNTYVFYGGSVRYEDE